MKLSICIPTFNRREKVLAQTDRIVKTGILAENQQVELVISDNNSDDNTYEDLLILYGKEPCITIYRQEKNLGIVGNLHFLFNIAKGSYIWFLSDDDPVNTSSINDVLSLITNSPCKFYLLNFVTDQSPKAYWNISEDYLSLFNEETWGGFGLLSVQVINKAAFTDFYNSNINYNLCQPVAISLYGLFYLGGKMCFDIVAITHHAGDYSWKNRALQVASVYLYDSISELKKYGVDDVYDNIISRLKKLDYFCRSSVLHIIKNLDYRYALRLYNGNLLGCVFYLTLKRGIKNKCFKMWMKFKNNRQR